jgi:hypothetical protein
MPQKPYKDKHSSLLSNEEKRFKMVRPSTNGCEILTEKPGTTGQKWMSRTVGLLALTGLVQLLIVQYIISLFSKTN